MRNGASLRYFGTVRPARQRLQRRATSPFEQPEFASVVAGDYA